MESFEFDYRDAIPPFELVTETEKDVTIERPDKPPILPRPEMPNEKKSRQEVKNETKSGKKAEKADKKVSLRRGRRKPT